MTIAASGIAPCAAAPVATQSVQGGGSVMPAGQPGAPTPPGSAAAQPSTAVTGGGPGATYAPAQSPIQVGSYIPAPACAAAPVPAPAATGAAVTAPPEPMAFPDVSAAPSSTLPGSPAPSALPTASGLPGQVSESPVTTAADRPRWAEWKLEFQRLGLPERLIASLGASTMSDTELADAYVEAEARLGIEQGTQPSTTGTRPVDAGSTSSEAGWNDAWEQRFTKLGLGAEDLAMVRDEAIKRGASETEIARLYEQLAQQMATTGAEGANVPPVAGDVTVESVSAKFIAAGAPKELVEMFAANATSPQGLDASLTTLQDRVTQLEERGWKQKLEKSGLDAGMIWQLAMGGAANPLKPTMTGELPTDGEIQQKVTLMQRSQAGLVRNIAGAAVSLVPGVQLLERIREKNFVTNSDMVTEGKLGMLNDGLAVASGVALGAVLLNKGRSIGSLRQGVLAAKGGYQSLAKASVAGLAEQSSAARITTMAQAGELTPGKLLFNGQLRREVSGLAHVEAAAKQFNQHADTKLDGLTRESVRQLFTDVGTGSATAGGARLNRMPFTAGDGARIVAGGDGAETLAFNGKLSVGDGRSQLAAMAKVAAGQQQLPDLSDMQRAGLGDVMAGRVANEIGIGRDGAPARKLRRLDDHGTPPSWYTDLVGAAPARPVPGRNAGSAASAD